MSEPRKVLQGATGDWEVVVGLEVHAQVKSVSKLFSGASAAYGAGPNEHVSLVDAAMPGMLPVINKFCVEQAIRTGLGLNAKINLWSRFDRKNYFYPDLPQGYQISQFKDPIVGEGEIEIELEGGATQTIGIERLHLEQDAGKSIHDLAPNASYVDLNRSGVALMEIVSKPDMRSAEEGAAYFSKIRTIVRYLGTCDGNMDEGSMRADVNVSVCRAGNYEKFRETGDFKYLGTRTETKNVNSIRFTKQVIDFEARRQIEVLEAGGTINQETLLFDPKTGETRTMRSKEDAHDYRYFPDPDLLPLEFAQAWVDEIKASLPELPDATKRRFRDKFGITPNIAIDLALDIEVAKAFDLKVLDYVERKHGLQGRHAVETAYGRSSGERLSKLSSSDRADILKQAEPYFQQMTEGAGALASVVVGQVFATSNESDVSAAKLISELDLVGLIELIWNRTISGKIAKEVFALMVAGEETGDPADIVEKRGLKQVTDTGAIEKVIDEIIAANPEQVAKVKEKPKTFGWFVGQVMKAMQGKANPQAVNEILKKKLGV